MDLSRIVLSEIRADRVGEFVRALEELPEETIQGDSHPDRIKAWKDPYNENGIQLYVRYSPLQEAESIVFNAPQGSSECTQIKDSVGEDGIRFMYKGKLYTLGKSLITY